MEVTIKIEEYLSEDERYGIAVECFKEEIRKRFSKEKEIERILSNSYYTFVIDEVSKIVPDYKERIVKRVEDAVLNNNLDFEIFYKGDYGREASAANKIINRTVLDNTELIKERTVEAIKNFDLTPYIKQKLYDAFSELSNSAGDIANFMWQQMVKEREEKNV